jgi:aminoglycoside/choline kinase family phosphotransferase
MSERSLKIRAFLDAAGWGTAERAPLAGDASFRRYERLAGNGRRAVLMDAPPPEDVAMFAHVDSLLAGCGLSVPAILARDDRAGLLLLEDFGDATYTRELAAGALAEPLYALAVDVLIALHREPPSRVTAGLPPYDDEFMLTEVGLLAEWYAPAVLDAPLDAAAQTAWRACWQEPLALARRVPETIVLRDYHVDNLMWLDDRDGLRRCGLLDFQGALVGPVGYDLVSLLEDARRDVPLDLARAMYARYLAAFPDLDADKLRAAWSILGAQRNAKIVGLFTRLSRRDGKHGYLAHLPRVWRWLSEDLRHPALAPVADWLARYLPVSRRVVPPAI